MKLARGRMTVRVLDVLWIASAMAAVSLGSSCSPKPGGAGGIRTTDETQYLDFSLGVDSDSCDHAGDGITDPRAAIYALLDCHVNRLVTRIRDVGNEKTRQLGYNIIVSPWNSPDAFSPMLEQAFKVALARHVALHVTVESHYFWDKRPDLWNYFDTGQPGYDAANRANVEWSDWQGTPNRMRYLDWGAPQNLGAPHMCYLSARVQSEVARLGALIGAAIKTGVDTLAAAGHPELFSGVTIGSEPSLDNYTNVDTLDPALGRLMAKDGAPKVRLGYCAFTALGYSMASPPSSLSDAAATANQKFIASWAKAVSSAGVPAAKLYTHIAAGISGTDATAADFSNAPISIAFVDFARPGWTTYPQGQLKADFGPLETALAAHGNPHWGSTEAAPFDGAMAIPAYDFLKRHYDSGATVVVMNVGATGTLGATLSNAVFGTDAVAAYQRFLRGQ